jgi:DNA primase
MTNNGFTSINDIIAQLKSQISIEQVADALGLKQRLSLTETGKSLQGDCITGHSSRGHKCFSIETEKNYFNCFSCRISGDIIELVQQSEQTGKLEAIRYLASTFHPDILALIEELESNLTDEKRLQYQRSTLYQAIYREGKRLLQEPVGAQIMTYLENERGYDRTLIEKTDFIYWDTESRIRQFLLSKYPDKQDQIHELKLVGSGGDDFRLAIPFKDRNGIFTGFLKRAHVKEGFNDGIRWDSTPGMQKSDIFGLHRIRNQDTVVIVEGYPDATYFPALGVTNIVALGQATISEKYFEGLRSKNIRRIILALDNDITGNTNTQKICKLLADSEYQVFVIDPASYGSHKDPDEYVKANGIVAFKALVDQALSASEWYVTKMLSNYPTSTEVGMREALSEALDFADSLSSPIDCAQVIDQIQKALNIAPEILQLEFQRVKDRQSKDRLKKNVSDLNSVIRKLIDEGKDEEAVRLLVEKPSEYLSEFSARKVVPEQSTIEFIQFKKDRDSKRQPNERLGFELKTFSEIDTYLNGLQKGLYIIGAYPNVGKTAFMTSICIDVLDSNKDASVLFFTMDDSRDTIINRFLAGKADLAINSVQVGQSEPLQQIKLEKAYEWLHDMALQKRFEVREMNEALTMDTIEHIIRMHPKRENLLVFIDGVYNVPLDGKFDSLRTQNIERANRIKQLVKFFNLPVIVTAELRKKQGDVKFTTNNATTVPTMHDLMESGKYGYNADVVWLIYPENESSYRSEEKPRIKISFEKNKLSSNRDVMTMEFYRSHSSMKPAPLFHMALPAPLVEVPSVKEDK